MAMAKTLIVEDSTFFRQLLKETLLSRFPEMDISEAGNAEEALSKMVTFAPDLIFVDIRLPGESGLEFTRKIRSTYPDIPIIILTSYDLPEYRKAAKEYQADHFLSKGTTTKENILEMVKSILSNRDIDLNENTSKDQSK
jgi:DNA-binding NarL/FixJ family response regulator